MKSIKNHDCSLCGKTITKVEGVIPGDDYYYYSLVPDPETGCSVEYCPECSDKVPEVLAILKTEEET